MPAARRVWDGSGSRGGGRDEDRRRYPAPGVDELAGVAGAEGLGRGLDLHPSDGLGEALDAELGGALLEHLVGGIDLVGPLCERTAAADGVVEPGLVPGDEARGHAGEAVVAGP